MCVCKYIYIQIGEAPRDAFNSSGVWGSTGVTPCELGRAEDFAPPFAFAFASALPDWPHARQHVFIYIYKYVYVCVCMIMYVCTYVSIYIYILLQFEQIQKRGYVHANIYIYKYIYLCVCACAYV